MLNQIVMHGKSTLLLLLALSFALFAQAQESVVTDVRDGNSYPIVAIGDLYWFASNLRFETPKSWCAQQVDGEHCDKGNFYFNTHLDSLCPAGWRVPTWTDWETSLTYFMELQQVNPTSVHHDTLNYGGIGVRGMNLINDARTLNILPTGWIEGNKAQREVIIRERKPANFWVVDDVTEDERAHIHMWPEGYLKHSHEENISGKLRKRRRFSVRCVRDK